MPLFGGPSAAEFHRLERQFERMERQLEKLVELQEKHAERANGHPARVVWRGMTWPQIMGLGMLVALLGLVGFEAFEVESIRGYIVEALQQAEPAVNAILPLSGLLGLF